VKKKLTIIFSTLFAILSFSAFAINIFGILQKAKPSEVGVVLGNEVLKSGIPSQRLKARLDHGIQLFQEQKIKRLIVSGGVGASGFDEAKSMAAYLREHGVPEEKIITDSLGLTSSATSKNAKDMLSDNDSIVGISQIFHLYRVKLSLKNAGFKNVSVEGPHYFEFRDFYSSMREVAAIIKYYAFNL